MKTEGAATRRSYEMRARAEAADETRLRILEAVISSYRDPAAVGEPITVASIARRADVSPQTILRLYGDKEGLFVAAFDHAREALRRRHRPVPGRSSREVATRLADHYESHGDATVRIYHDVSTSEVLRGTLEQERAYHRAWCEDALAHLVADAPQSQRTRRIAQAAAVLDVWTWQSLRREGGLSRVEVEDCLTDMLHAALGTDE